MTKFPGGQQDRELVYRVIRANAPNALNAHQIALQAILAPRRVKVALDTLKRWKSLKTTPEGKYGLSHKP